MDLTCCSDPEPKPKFWHLVGECGLDTKGNYLTESIGEYVFWLQMGIGFLRHAVGDLPSDWVLEVLWAPIPHGEGEFPIIALGFNNLQEDADANSFAHSLLKNLRVFDKAVDWEAIASSPSLTSAKDRG
jgi:hypothetical protein